MDSITQAALGGVVGELVLGRKIGWKGMAWGLFFGTLPDLDILIFPWLDQAEKLRWHRGVSHSILMMLVASFAFAKPLSLLHQKKGLTTQRAGWFVFWVWSTHVLIDVFTSYGTQVLEPFSDTRVAFNNLFIIDLFFTLPLLGCVFYRLGIGMICLKQWLQWRSQKVEEDDEEDEGPNYSGFSLKWAKVAISLCCLYVLFSFVMKIWATYHIKGHLADEYPQGEVVAVAPTPFNTLLWRGLIETEEGYFVTYWSPFDQRPSKYDFLAKNHDLAERFQGKEMFETLKWFSRGHWVAREIDDGKVMFVDVRFGEVRDLESQQQYPMFQWHMQSDDDGKMHTASYRPRDLDFKKAMILVWHRVRGDRDRWESIKPF